MFKHILIPTDGTDLSRKAVIYGMQLAKSVGARVTAITISEPYHVASMDAVLVAETPEEHEAQTARVAERALEQVRMAAEARASAPRLCARCTTSRIAPSSIAPARAAATSSSWRRTEGAAWPRCWSAARRPRCSPTARSRCWSIAEPRRQADGDLTATTARISLAAHFAPQPGVRHARPLHRRRNGRPQAAAARRDGRASARWTADVRQESDYCSRATTPSATASSSAFISAPTAARAADPLGRSAPGAAHLHHRPTCGSGRTGQTPTRQGAAAHARGGSAARGRLGVEWEATASPAPTAPRLQAALDGFAGSSTPRG